MGIINLLYNQATKKTSNLSILDIEAHLLKICIDIMKSS